MELGRTAQMYGIPHGWGANLLMCNTDKVTPAPDLVGRGVRRRPRPYKGKITAYDSPIYIADAALYLMETQPDLGIKNPYALDADAVRRGGRPAQDAAAQHVGEYWSDYTKEVAGLRERRHRARHHVAGHRQPGRRRHEGAGRGDRCRRRASTGWSDTWMIAAKAKHPNCAYKWMDWIISPEVNAQVAECFGEAPANAKACDQTADKTFCTTYHAADAAYARQISTGRRRPRSASTAAATSRARTTRQWTQAWTEIKG